MYRLFYFPARVYSLFSKFITKIKRSGSYFGTSQKNMSLPQEDTDSVLARLAEQALQVASPPPQALVPGPPAGPPIVVSARTQRGLAGSAYKSQYASNGASGVIVYRRTGVTGIELLCQYPRWSGGFSQVLHRLQEPVASAGGVVSLLQRCTVHELLLLHGAASFWDVMPHAHDTSTNSAYALHPAEQPSPRPLLAGETRQGLADIPAIWLKDASNMNGVIAVHNWAMLQVPVLAGAELAVRAGHHGLLRVETAPVLCKGGRNVGERAVDAAVRELREETGLVANPADLLPLAGGPPGCDWFTLEVGPGTVFPAHWPQPADACEALAVAWVPLTVFRRVAASPGLQSVVRVFEASQGGGSAGGGSAGGGSAGGGARASQGASGTRGAGGWRVGRSAGSGAA